LGDEQSEMDDILKVITVSNTYLFYVDDEALTKDVEDPLNPSDGAKLNVKFLSASFQLLFTDMFDELLRYWRQSIVFADGFAIKMEINRRQQIGIARL
jgi:hypothetical protein